MSRTLAVVIAIATLLMALALFVETVLSGEIVRSEYATERNVKFSSAGDAGVVVYVQYLGSGQEERRSWIRRKDSWVLWTDTGIMEKAMVVSAYPDSVLIESEPGITIRGTGDGIIVLSTGETLDTIRVRVEQFDGEYVLSEI